MNVQIGNVFLFVVIVKPVTYSCLSLLHVSIRSNDNITDVAVAMNLYTEGLKVSRQCNRTVEKNGYIKLSVFPIRTILIRTVHQLFSSKEKQT